MSTRLRFPPILTDFYRKMLLLLFLVIPVVIVHAQLFDSVEHLVGLDQLEGNNGVAVADFDRDHDLDIFVVAKSRENQNDSRTFSRLFRNNNDGSFTDITESSGLMQLSSGPEIDEEFLGLDGAKFGVSWGDYNNDGFPDLFFTSVAQVQLFHNNGDGTFTDITESSGLSLSSECRNTGATWFDYNNDSYLDIFISDWEGCNENSLFRNNGNGTFEKVSFTQNELAAPSYSMLPFDFNNDGWIDMYVTNDKDYPNNLYINQGGTGFIDNASDYGLDNAFDDMGISIGDVENDGDLDLFVTGISENALLLNDGTNNFSEQSAQFNISETNWSWGCRFADFDLDFDEDLVIVNGFRVNVDENVYYENRLEQGAVGFEDKSEEKGLSGLTKSTESLPFDFDNDGDLDLFISNTDRSSSFYENKTISTNQNDKNWFKVALEGTTSNRDAIGSTVHIKTSSGDLIRFYSGLGFLSQNLQPVHFGLDSETQIAELIIHWPSGLTESYTDLTANTTVKLTEGVGLEVLNIAPSDKILGCTNPNSCNYNPAATADDGSCAFLESKTITGADVSSFNNIEEYQYTLEGNSSAHWEVEGGTLLDGQGTANIRVQWGLEPSGLISVIEQGSSCQSTSVSKEVSLNISEVAEDISIARIWNEALLEAIRRDYARPNVHARNLFHFSIALYDSWAHYDSAARPYFLGNEVHGFQSVLEEFESEKNIEESQIEAMSYAAYRLLLHRFSNSPGAEESIARFNLIMDQLNFDTAYTSTDYTSGNPGALGNYLAEQLIAYGFQDGSNELGDYAYSHYAPINPALNLFGDFDQEALVDPNRWQPLTFNTFIDQSGNLIDGDTPEFLGPEWGNVTPFALLDEDKTVFTRNQDQYQVYHDPGFPPQLNVNTNNASSALYKWNFALVSYWSSHLDPTDNVLWDISPRSIGNIDINSYPQDFSDYENMYNTFEGGDGSAGRTVNPITGQAYQEQFVPRADYARVLAEFWADGPDSETPPGHWFTILNYVNDHPLFSPRFNGEGANLSPLEWDVKAYFILAGAMHDAAIAAWGIKGWYDYIRPISAIRYMSGLGQSSDENLPNYHPGGIPLEPGFVELIDENDPLVGAQNEHLNRIKLYAWRGHDQIDNAQTDLAGVGWILAEHWWPYQRPSFVTPPFAGYVSGHSTYSRAAAEVMTLLTGSEYFPGGMGEFIAKKDAFLVFEKGPSVDVVLQWATYRDASDQTSLSRIWGGIHPPADDIPGRIIGEQVGIDAFNFALAYFSSTPETPIEAQESVVFPNPVVNNTISVSNVEASETYQLFDALGRYVPLKRVDYDASRRTATLELPNALSKGIYTLKRTENSSIIIVQ